MPTTSTAVVTVSLLLVLVVKCRCSSGDRSPDYKVCLEKCSLTNCSSSTPYATLSLSLILLGWSCQDNCGYYCMHKVTLEDVLHQRRVRQFHGKWPFVRVLGVQEPASVLFSIFNAAAVVMGYRHFSSDSPTDYHLRTSLSLQLLVSLNTWLWSTVFHTRDLNWTEKMDYFSAALLIVCGLVVQFIRLSGREAMTWQWIYVGVWLILYLLHVSYLSLIKFDYGYNMAACVMAGTLYTVIWTVWSIKEWRQRQYVWKCMAACVWGSCTVLLELLDFPPLLWLVDAHALWHLSTVPIPLLWYSFLTDDANYETRLQRKNI